MDTKFEDDGDRGRPRSRTIPGALAVGLGIVVAVVLIAWYVSAPAIEWYTVPTGDMAPAVPRGGRIGVERISDPEKFEFRFKDIVVFSNPLSPEKLSAKRVVGLETDRIAVLSRGLLRNGKSVSEPYVRYGDNRKLPAGSPPSRAYPETVIPADHLFVLGDSRNISLDSRHWGPVPVSSVVGVVVKLGGKRIR